jgi:hypothetical protein
MYGITVVSYLMSQKLALRRDIAGEADLVDGCVESLAKRINIRASNCISSSEVVAVKEMNDIGSDTRPCDVSSISAKIS